MSESTQRGEYRPIYTVILDSPEYQALTPSAKLLALTLKLKLGAAGIGIAYDDELRECTGLEDIEAPRQELIDGNWLILQKRVHWVRNGFRFEPGLHLRNEKHRLHLERTIQGLPRLGIVLLYARYYELPPPFSQGAMEGLRHAPSWDPPRESQNLAVNAPTKAPSEGSVGGPTKASPKGSTKGPPRGHAEPPREAYAKHNTETERVTTTPTENDGKQRAKETEEREAREGLESDPLDQMIALHPSVRPILEQMEHRGGLEATLSTLRVRFLSDDEGGLLDPCVAGLDTAARMNLVAAAFVEMQDQGVTGWNPRHFAGFVRRLRAAQAKSSPTPDSHAEDRAESHRELQDQMARFEAAEIARKDVEAQALAQATREAEDWLAIQPPDVVAAVEGRMLERLRRMGFKGELARASKFMLNGVLPDVVAEVKREAPHRESP